MEYMVVGLGNPGAKYDATRHNIGARVVRAFGERNEAVWEEDTRAHAHVARVHTPQGTVFHLVCPTTYMNVSGPPVAAVAGRMNHTPKIVVVHDDIDLPFGSVRVAENRGAGGHRGVRSVQEALHTQAFIRVRIGIVPVNADGVPTKPRGEAAVHRFVLSAFRESEQAALPGIIARAHEALTLVAGEGVEAAMRTINAARDTST